MALSIWPLSIFIAARSRNAPALRRSFARISEINGSAAAMFALLTYISASLSCATSFLSGLEAVLANDCNACVASATLFWAKLSSASAI